MEIRLSPQEDGQSSVYDAMMFLSIMLVASTLIMGLSNHLLRAEDVRRFEDLDRYAARFANAFLSSTVPNASYVDSYGFNISSRDISVQDMIIEELVLLKSGVPEQNFGGPDGYNSRILQVSSALLDEDRFVYALSAHYGNQKIVLGNNVPFEDLSKELAAQTTRIPIPDEENEIAITVYLWWK